MGKQKKGLPDISIVEELAKALHVSLTELFTGDLKTNENVSGNIKKNTILCMPDLWEHYNSCRRREFFLLWNNTSKAGSRNRWGRAFTFVETVDNEFSIVMKHSMSKGHYVSFIAYVTSGSVEIVKIYPEQDISVRFRKKGHGFLYGYCNRHGLFKKYIWFYFLQMWKRTITKVFT